MTTDTHQKSKFDNVIYLFCFLQILNFQFFSRDEIMDVIKKVYFYKQKKNLPVYGVQTPNLAKYTTTANDVNIGVSRRPPPNQRRNSQDLYIEGQNTTASKP